MARRWSSSRSPPLSRLWSAAERTLQNQAHTIEMSARLAFELLGRFKYNVTGGAPGAPGPSAHSGTGSATVEGYTAALLPRQWPLSGRQQLTAVDACTT